MNTPSPSVAATASAAAEFNSADVMFAQMMIPHHQQAVEMSDLLLSKDGVDPRVVSLARQIKAAQQPEIDTMTSWLTAWGHDAGGGRSDGGMHHDMGGMLSTEEMAALEKADGPAGQRLFLKGMIKHHEGAITMAEAEIRNGTNQDAVQLAKDIVAAQQQEITTMRQLLTDL